MNFLIVLVCTIAFTWLIRKPLKKYPALFYALAVLLSAAYVLTVFGTVPAPVKNVIFILMQKCTLALSFFVVVMFIGVFHKDSAVGLGLRPVRAELSIMGCILAIGHMVVYLVPFAPRLLSGTADTWVYLFMVTAIALLALLVVLGVTSLQRIKRAMNVNTWKKIQRWAYVFFGLVYIHLMIVLLPAALSNGGVAQVSVVIYTILFGAYGILRVRRAMIDRKAAAA